MDTDNLRFPRRCLSMHGERLKILAAWIDKLADVIGPRGGTWQLPAGADLVAESSTAWCYRATLSNGEVVYCKYEIYPLLRSLRFFLRPSRNVVEAFASQELESLNVPTPEVLAIGERRIIGFPQDSCLVTREVQRSMDLRRYVEEVWAEKSADQRSSCYRVISNQLVAQLQRIHAAGFFHQDLKWRNLLVQDRNGTLVLFWIDAPRARYRRWWRHRGVVLDLSALARVAVSVTSPFERMRFVRAYLGPDAAAGAAAALYRDVARHLARRPPIPLTLQFPADQKTGSLDSVADNTARNSTSAVEQE